MMQKSDLGRYLAAIYQEHGVLSPQIVLDAARDPGHPLHGEFDWDDRTAAESFRLAQALQLIRRVKIKVVDTSDPDFTITVRRYVALRDDTEPHRYIDATEVQDEATKARLLTQMQREWEALRKRWHAYGEFWSLIAEDFDAA